MSFRKESELPRIILISDIQQIYGCSYRTAQKKYAEARSILGHETNNQGHKGAKPLTREQFYHAQGLNTPPNEQTKK